VRNKYAIPHFFSCKRQTQSYSRWKNNAPVRQIQSTRFVTGNSAGTLSGQMSPDGRELSGSINLTAPDLNNGNWQAQKSEPKRKT
jgi:hypothetical protein